jgi:hypothetical protein
MQICRFGGAPTQPGGPTGNDGGGDDDASVDASIPIPGNLATDAGESPR